VGAFLVQRLIQATAVVFLSTVVIFLGLRLIPGDPALILAGQDASPQSIAAIRLADGLDQPLPVQYIIWLGNVVRGDLGVSFFTRTPVGQLIAQRVPATLELGVAAMLLSVLLGLPTGILAAVRQHQY
jgi:peptide/nickel transport system permease protein